MSDLASKDDKAPALKIAVGSYCRVTETGDWEELVGVVEEFLDARLCGVQEPVEDGFIQLFFPVGRQAQEDSNLQGVNDYPGTVLSELRLNEYLHHFKETSLEVVDPEEL